MAAVILNSQQWPELDVLPLLPIVFCSQQAHEFLTI